MLDIILRLLAVVIFTAITIGLTWLLLKLFPSLKKLNWKVVFGIFFILKLFDLHSTWLCFMKYRAHEAELNVVFALFYKIGLGLTWSFILANIISILLGFFLIKITLVKKSRLYFIAFCLLVAVLIAIANNYVGYFFYG